MEDYETILKEIRRFSEMQQTIFKTNSQLLEENEKHVKILSGIKEEYENEMHNLEEGKRTKVLIQISKLYETKEVPKQVSYYVDVLADLETECKLDSWLAKEFSRAKRFIIASVGDFFIESLESDYDECMFSEKLKEADEFLISVGSTEHVGKALSTCFKKFIARFEENMLNENIRYFDILMMSTKDLEHIFVDPQKYRNDFIVYFCNYIKNEVLDSIYFKYHNNIEKFMLVFVNVYEFLNAVEEEQGQRANQNKKQVEEVERAGFKILKSFLENYYDKLELFVVIDKKYKLFEILFLRFENVKLKIWLATLCEAYLESVQSKDQEALEKYYVVFSLQSHKFQNIEDFMKAYLKKHIDRFLEEIQQRCLQLHVFEKTQADHSSFKKSAELLEHYKQYFRGLIDHLDKIALPNLRALKIKNSQFREFILKNCIEAFMEFYHKELTQFLNMDLGEIDKKNYFEFYANEIKQKMNEELFGY